LSVREVERIAGYASARLNLFFVLGVPGSPGSALETV
jgi:hypothetical protein